MVEKSSENEEASLENKGSKKTSGHPPLKLLDLGLPGSNARKLKGQQVKKPIGPINRSIIPNRNSPPATAPDPKPKDEGARESPKVIPSRIPSSKPRSPSPKSQSPIASRHQTPQAPSSAMSSVQPTATGDDDVAYRRTMFWVGIMLLGMLAYVWYTVDQVRMNRIQGQEENLQKAIAMFPKNPYEYNERQRAFYAVNYWRRFNIRNISILGGSILSAMLLARWHRKRRAFLQRRKTLVYWAWTMGAGMLGILWGAYIVKKSQQNILTQTYRNPMGRALLIIGCILLASILLFAYRLRKRKGKKQKMLEEWRMKKHRDTMRKPQDLQRVQQVRAIKPVAMPPPGK